MKMVNIDKKTFISSEQLEIARKFWKKNRGGDQIDLPASLGLMIILLYEYNFCYENLFFCK